MVKKVQIISQGGKAVWSWISIPATRVRLPSGYLPQKKDHQKPPSVPFMTPSRKAYLKIFLKKSSINFDVRKIAKNKAEGAAYCSKTY